MILKVKIFNFETKRKNVENSKWKNEDAYFTKRSMELDYYEKK